MGGYGEISPADFGEPTESTRETLANTLERLKNLTVGVPYEHVIRIGDHIIERPPLPDGLGPITQYEYDQIRDPLFDPEEETDFGFRILEASDETFSDWFARQGQEEKIYEVYYKDGIIDIHYAYWPSTEELDISDYMQIDAMPGTPKWREQLLAMIRSVEEPIENGANIPTEGTMKHLIAVLEQEIAKRYTE